MKLDSNFTKAEKEKFDANWIEKLTNIEEMSNRKRIQNLMEEKRRNRKLIIAGVKYQGKLEYLLALLKELEVFIKINDQYCIDMLNDKIILFVEIYPEYQDKIDKIRLLK